MGIEGLVIKGLAERYQPGRRAWLKLRSRTTGEAIVGAVTGSLRAPERLILGLVGPEGRLLVAGGTAPLRRMQQATVARLLRPPTLLHPWPDVVPSDRTGVFGGDRHLDVALVEPELVVEVETDTAFEYGHWRHLTRLIRVRPDLGPNDVAGPR